MRKLYFRPTSKQRIVEASANLKKESIAFYVDVIIGRPAEKEKNLRETLRLLLDLPDGYHIWINKLSVFPNSNVKETLADMNRTHFNAPLNAYYTVLFHHANGSRYIEPILILLMMNPIKNKSTRKIAFFLLDGTEKLIEKIKLLGAHSRFVAKTASRMVQRRA